MVNDQTLDERDDEINQQSYQAAKINNKDADDKLRKTEFVQTLKRKYNLEATANDDEVFDILKELYSPFVFNHDRFIFMDILSSEMTKYVANAMQ